LFQNFAVYGLRFSGCACRRAFPGWRFSILYPPETEAKKMPIAIPRSGADDRPIVPDVCISDLSKLVIRSATVEDVHGMSALINQYASANVMLARGPQYLYQHIQDYMVATAPAADGGRDVIVACGAVHVLWADLGEIRSVAVHPSCQGQGFGKRLVSMLVERCRSLALPRVFVFTLVPDFFAKCGFKEFDRDDMPPSVWVECSKCPKFYCCDEIAMLLPL
jgi:amino-acid N-acetyltransferase